MLYIESMTENDIARMAGLDAEIRNAVAHEGYGSPLVAGLLTEQEALLTLWLVNAEAKHDAYLQDRE